MAPPPEWANKKLKITKFSDEIDCDGKKRKGTATDRTGWTLEFSTGDIGDDNRWKGNMKNPGGNTEIGFTWDYEKGELKVWPLFFGHRTWKVDHYRHKTPNAAAPMELELVYEEELSDGCTETIRVTMEVT